MPVLMSGNLINVGPGDPAFIIGSNFTDHFEIGNQKGDDYWLRADIVGPQSEFIFNGRLFLPDQPSGGTVIDNFPKGPEPKGWVRKQLADRPGYLLVDQQTGKTLFGFDILDNHICHVVTNLYSQKGELVAETSMDNFLVHKGPALIGTGGIRIG